MERTDSVIGDVQAPLGRIAVLAAIVSCATAGLIVGSVVYPAQVLLWLAVAVTTILTLLPIGVGLARTRVDIFEPPVLLGLFFFIGFPLAAVMAFGFGQEFDAGQSFDWFPGALLVAALGLCAWYLGYYLGPGAILARALPSLPRRWDDRRAAFMVGGFSAAGWAAQLLAIARGGYLHGFRTQVSLQLSTTVAWVGEFALVALACASVQYFERARQGRSSAAWRAAFFGLFALELAYTVPTGSRQSLLMTLAIPLIGAYYVLGRVRWSVFVVLGLAVVLLVFPIENAYRMAVSESVDINRVHPSFASVQTLRRATVVALSQLGNLSGTAYAVMSVRTVIERLNMVGIVSAIVRWTPGVWPFDFGRSFQAFVTSLAPPRFILNKPISEVGGVEFAHRYRLIRPVDSITSVGPTRLGELYQNFWLGGVLAGMWAEGALSRVGYEYFIGRMRPSPSGVVLFIFFVLTFVQFNAFADYALMLKLFAVLILVMLWAGAGRGTDRARPPAGGVAEV